MSKFILTAILGAVGLAAQDSVTLTVSEAGVAKTTTITGNAATETIKVLKHLNTIFAAGETTAIQAIRRLVYLQIQANAYEAAGTAIKTATDAEKQASAARVTAEKTLETGFLSAPVQ
jgi:hypothetical protein